MTIWKFPIVDIDDWVELHMPADAQVLHFATQQGVPCIWALVSDDAPRVKRRFRLVGTGHDLESAANLAYRGTSQLLGGSLVLHLFEPVV